MGERVVSQYDVGMKLGKRLGEPFACIRVPQDEPHSRLAELLLHQLRVRGHIFQMQDSKIGWLCRKRRSGRTSRHQGTLLITSQ
jgi:hypothetical protein